MVKNYRSRRKENRKTLIAIGIVFFSLFGATVSYTLINSRQASNMPASIKNQLTFSPLIIPIKSHTIKASSYTFSSVEDGTKILSYQLSVQGSKITVSQYIQPPQFTEITNYKEQFLENVINQYETIPSAGGTIYLGKATKPNNHQLAMMIENGLIILMLPDSNLSSSVWRSIGDQLVIQPGSN